MKLHEKARICVPNWLNCRSIPGKLFEFLEWEKQTPEVANALAVGREEFRQDRGPGAQPEYDQYDQYVISELQKPQAVRLMIKGAERFPENVAIRATLNSVSFEAIVHSEIAIAIQDQHIGRLHLNGVRSPVKLRNSFIRELIIARNTNVNFSCERTYVGKLWIAEMGLQELHMTDCAILSVAECPPTDTPNPFRGPVVLKRLWLARDKALGAGESQQLRNVRAHLNALNNSLAAGAFHGAELALDRRHESRWSSVFSWFYEVFSDYGNSISRPLIWFWVIYGLMLGLALMFDPLQVGDKDPAGWQAELGNFFWLRAIVYPFLAIFNPLGIAGKTLLVAKTWYWAFSLTALSLIGTATLALALIGLRRRFKLG